MTDAPPTAAPPETPPPAKPGALIVAIVGTCLVLLVAVVVVGLARGTLDETGVAIVLSTMITGIVTGVAVKKSGPP